MNEKSPEIAKAIVEYSLERDAIANSLWDAVATSEPGEPPDALAKALSKNNERRMQMRRAILEDCQGDQSV